MQTQTTTELLNILNARRTAAGEKPLKTWSESKAKLLARIDKYLDPMLEEEARALGLADAEAEGTRPEDDMGLGCDGSDHPFDPQDQVGEPDEDEDSETETPSNEPVRFLGHDAAITFIRRHRRRRDIFIRIATQPSKREFQFVGQIKVSAKQARAYVTELIAPDKQGAGATIRVEIDPPHVPPGSKTKGRMLVG